MSGRWIAVAGAILAAAGVGLGAFGAHGLEDYLRQLGHEADLAKRVAWFETAVRYQLYHALGMLAVAALAWRQPAGGYGLGAMLFLVGVVLFSGSLFAMTFAGESWRKLGMVTPVGGLSLIIGWIAVAIAAARSS